jgi:hypothetical protein
VEDGGSGTTGLSGQFVAYQCHPREGGQVAPGLGGERRPDLDAGDPVAAAGERNGRRAGGAANLKEPVTGLEARQAHQLVVQPGRVAGRAWW